MRHRQLTRVFGVFGAVCAPVLLAEVASTTFAPLQVIGDADAVVLQTGSSAYISTAELRMQHHLNVNQVLQRVPGVYVREEDGYGHFPNISLRGADGTRSEKLTLMEDGVLVAPAPYSAPGAYYSPTAARMVGIEVQKGSSQVRFGPHTTGGVLNYLSTPIPTKPETRLNYQIGENQTHSLHLHSGTTLAGEQGRLGALIELYGARSEGFREIQGSDRDTGFERLEPMLKLSWEPNSALRQRWEFKAGWTDFNADETYLGLSEADAKATPTQRYAATQFDNIDTEHLRLHLRYQAELRENLDLESTVYLNKFDRNWYKIDHVGTLSAPAVDARGQLLERTSLHTALLEPGLLSVLRGEAPGAIGVKANRRSYEAAGWDNHLTWSFDQGALAHRVRAGLRVHQDSEERKQNVDVYSVAPGAAFSSFRRGIPGEESDRRQESLATAVYLEDEMRWGAVTFKPGLRYETVEQEDRNRSKRLSGTIDAWAGGVGALWDVNESLNLFGGVYRGVSLPGPSSHLGSDIREEESVSYELGLRYAAETHRAELVGFYVDYQNLVGTDTGLALGGESNVNAGEAFVRGVELLLSGDLAGGALQVPVYVSATYTDSELGTALATGGGDDIYSGGKAGARLPYLPEWKLAFGIGLEQGDFSLRLDGTWVDESFGTAQNLDRPATSARQGLIDDAVLVDLALGWQVSPGLRLFAGVHNLFDETVLTSRLPEGPRNAAPRSGYLGLEWTFGE